MPGDPLSSIRTVTVGFGFAPNLLTPRVWARGRSRACTKTVLTAGGESHPALRTQPTRAECSVDWRLVRIELAALASTSVRNARRSSGPGRQADLTTRRHTEGRRDRSSSTPREQHARRAAGSAVPVPPTAATQYGNCVKKLPCHPFLGRSSSGRLADLRRTSISLLSRLLVTSLSACALCAVYTARLTPRAHAQAAPSSVPVALSTRNPAVTWGVIERTRDGVSSARARSAGGNGSGHDSDPKSDPNAKIEVRGLVGTLNKDDVHQTMEARQQAMNACTARARRAHGIEWVGGQMRFAFKVDAQGHVDNLRPVVSNVGHYELEQCITQVVLETQFPRPAGHAAAEFSWGMSVDAARSQPPAKLRPSVVMSSVRKHRRELHEQCTLPRRTRFQVTAYVSPTGEVLSAGAFTKADAAHPAVPCLVEQLSKWRLPKQKRLGKVSFALP